MPKINKKTLLVKPAEPLLCHHLPASSTGWQNPSSTAVRKRHRQVFVRGRCAGIKIKAEQPRSSRPAPSPPTPGCGSRTHRPLPERARASLPRSPRPPGLLPGRCSRGRLLPGPPPAFPGGMCPRPAHLPGRRPPGGRAAPAAPCSARLGWARRLRRGLKGDRGRRSGRGAAGAASPRAPGGGAAAAAARDPLGPAAPSPPLRRGNFLTAPGSRAPSPRLGTYRSRPARPPTHASNAPVHPPPRRASEKGQSGASLPLSPAHRTRQHPEVFPPVRGCRASAEGRRCGNPSLSHSFHKKSAPRLHTLSRSEPLQVLQPPFLPAGFLSLPLLSPPPLIQYTQTPRTTGM